MIACIKIVYLPVRPSNDDLYRQASAAVWSLAELCTAEIVTCLPVLRPLFFRPPRNTDWRSRSPHGGSRRWRDLLGQGLGSSGRITDETQAQPRRDVWSERKEPRTETRPVGLHCGKGRAAGEAFASLFATHQSQTPQARALSVNLVGDPEPATSAPPLPSGRSAATGRV